MPYNVFISHSVAPDEDGRALDALSEHLTRRHVSVTPADRQWKFGASIAELVEARIKAADCVVALLTRGGQQASYVNQELGIARSMNRPTLSIVENGTDVAAVHLDADYIIVGPDQPLQWLQSLQTQLVNIGAPADVQDAVVWAVLMTVFAIFDGRG
jgi:hypothetical protein